MFVNSLVLVEVVAVQAQRVVAYALYAPIVNMITATVMANGPSWERNSAPSPGGAVAPGPEPLVVPLAPPVPDGRPVVVGPTVVLVLVVVCIYSISK